MSLKAAFNNLNADNAALANELDRLLALLPAKVSSLRAEQPEKKALIALVPQTAKQADHDTRSLLLAFKQAAAGLLPDTECEMMGIGSIWGDFLIVHIGFDRPNSVQMIKQAGLSPAKDWQEFYDQLKSVAAPDVFMEMMNVRNMVDVYGFAGLQIIMQDKQDPNTVFSAKAGHDQTSPYAKIHYWRLDPAWETVKPQNFPGFKPR